MSRPARGGRVPQSMWRVVRQDRGPSLRTRRDAALRDWTLSRFRREGRDPAGWYLLGPDLASGQYMGATLDDAEVEADEYLRQINQRIFASRASVRSGAQPVGAHSDKRKEQTSRSPKQVESTPSMCTEDRAAASEGTVRESPSPAS